MFVKVHLYEQAILKHHKPVQFNIKYRMTVCVDIIRYKTVQFKTRVIKTALITLCIYFVSFLCASGNRQQHFEDFL